jgi:CheY-like chemotaxis protein
VSRVLVVHWHEQECQQRVEQLAQLGHFAEGHWRKDDGTALTRGLSADPPAAVVVDLGRLPSHGAAVATWLRQRRALRCVPIVFVPGDEAKTARVRATFPDAVFATWEQMATALPVAIAAPIVDPVVPKERDYSGKPLATKLGIAPGCRLLLVRAPADFARTLWTLPDKVSVAERLGRPFDVAVVFCGDSAVLQRDLPRAAAKLAAGGSVWIAWPKHGSGVPTDLDSAAVRHAGLGAGLVDTKVCAIDAVWSGLRFSVRRAAVKR